MDQRLALSSEVEEHSGVDHGWAQEGPRPRLCLQGGLSPVVLNLLLNSSIFLILVILFYFLNIKLTLCLPLSISASDLELT